MPVRVLTVLLLAVAALAMAWLAVYQVDDAFIVYRYAYHLAQGDGFVFNPGERVEGVTCFLWTLALVPWTAAGLDLPKTAPILTAACGLGILVLLTRRAAEASGRTVLAPRDLLPAVLLVGCPAFLYWSVGALETVPFALLIVAAVRDHAREMGGGVGSSRRSALWLGLACLMRPETPLVVAALALDRVLPRRGGGASALRLRETARWLGIVAAFAAPFLTFRRLYFGDWLPNTYYAKTGGPIGERLRLGWDYASEAAASFIPAFGALGAPVVIAGWALLAGLVVFALSDRRLRPEGWVVAAIVVAMVFEGGDWMVLHRLVVPALPLVATLGGAALLGAVERGRAGRLLAGVVVAAFLAHGAFTAWHERNGPRGMVVNAEGYRRAHREVARYLAAKARPGETVALMDIGMIGWHLPEQRIVDITGLTDRAIARAPGGFLGKRYAPSAVLDRNPRFLVLVPRFPIDERIHSDPAFAVRYRFLFSINHRFNWVPPSEYPLNLFERVGS